MNQPTPKEIRTALRDWLPHRLVTFRPGWKTRGRPWSYGIRGVMFHHWAGQGDGGQLWMEARSGAYPFCNATVRRGTGSSRDGEVMVISALSAWHSGLGGPWGRAGVPKDVAHLMVWGIEMEGPASTTPFGTDDMTDAQWDSSVRMACAIREVAGPEAFPNFSRAIRHGDWTDGTAGVAAYTLPTVRRKNDVWRPTKDIRRMCNRAWKERQK
jgi:hypothetical protein